MKVKKLRYETVPYNHPDGAWNSDNIRRSIEEAFGMTKQDIDEAFGTNKQDIEKILDDAFRKVFGEKW